jgi:peptidoglycan/xylan/chitin deacetylase (PgdA/CDA1 family)
VPDELAVLNAISGAVGFNPRAADEASSSRGSGTCVATDEVRPMDRTLKDRSLTVTNRLGVSRLLGQSHWRRRRLLILCYHGVASHDEHVWNSALYIPPALLDRRLAALRRNSCTVLPLDDAIRRLYRGELPERAVTLTFDDGYYDFLTEVEPRLAASAFPSTVYLPTLRTDHNFPVPTVLLSYMLWQRRGTMLRAPDVPGLGPTQYATTTAAQRSAIVARINLAIEPSDPGPDERDEICRTLARTLRLDYDEYVEKRILTVLRPAEVASLSARGVSFQLHTHRHRTPIEDDKFLFEIRENQQRLTEITGRRAEHFCYPSGVHRRSYLPLLRAEGIVSATTTEPGIAAQSSNPLVLPRFVDTSNVGDAEFEAWLNGMMPWLHGATRIAG